jgi:hypothetical protein
MSTFLLDKTYETLNTTAAFIEFHQDKDHRQAFNASHLIKFSLDPNPDAGTDKDEPPHKLSLVFSTADVVLLGWGLGFLADKLREGTLVAVGLIPKRYAELERTPAFVSAITITPVGKGEK